MLQSNLIKTPSAIIEPTNETALNCPVQSQGFRRIPATTISSSVVQRGSLSQAQNPTPMSVRHAARASPLHTSSPHSFTPGAPPPKIYTTKPLSRQCIPPANQYVALHPKPLHLSTHMARSRLPKISAILYRNERKSPYLIGGSSCIFRRTARSSHAAMLSQAGSSRAPCRDYSRSNGRFCSFTCPTAHIRAAIPQKYSP